MKEDKKFQSTLPIQGETINGYNLSAEDATFQSTLPIQGETQRYSRGGFLLEISIHSPYTGRDRHFCFQLHSRLYFNPLSLYRERQVAGTYIYPDVPISIHSPYTGRDFVCTHNPSALTANFNPLSLYRERLNSIYEVFISLPFQSTLPIQGETLKASSKPKLEGISIHSPYTGRDCPYPMWAEEQENFNPLSLYRERRRWFLSIVF